MWSSKEHYGRLALASFAFFGVMAFSLSVQAVSISPTPLFVSAQVIPNIMLAIDDSGSMDFELLIPANDGALWWKIDAVAGRSGFAGWGTSPNYDQDLWLGGLRLNFNVVGSATAEWKKFAYLFPNGKDAASGGRLYGDVDTNPHYAVPPLPRFAFARSSEYNKAYFDPLDTYTPWPSVGSGSYSNASVTAAKADPWRPGSTTYNLTQDFAATGTNYGFRLYTGMKLPVGTEIYAGGRWRILEAEGVVPFRTDPGSADVSDNTSYAIKYYPATFYVSQLLPASFGYTATPSLSGYAPGAAAPSLYKYEIKRDNFSGEVAYTAAIQNFANWFSYYRKRQLATRGGIAASFSDIRAARAAAFRINSVDDENPIPNLMMRDLSQDADRTAFFDSVYPPTGRFGTPNREALSYAGEQYRRTDSAAPIQYACQTNATILFTDGFSYASSVSSPPGNADGDQGSPYADTTSDTMADIAMRYYKTALRSDSGLPAGRVPVPSACNASTRAADLDCKRDLHMLTYGVTLGSRGILFDPNSNPAQNPYSNPPQWWSSFTDRSPTAVDDLWHATINGRGDMLNARTPADVSTAIKTALSNILVRTGSASAVATNSTRLDTSTHVYQAKFDSADWSGELLAYAVTSNGSVGALDWSTNNTIPAASSRNIVTWTGSQAVDFTTNYWSSLSQAQRDALNNGAADSVGQARLQWLRGETSQEQRNGGNFRNRTRLLGDIVNSDPLFVGKEDFGFSGLAGTESSSYSAFLAGKATRTPMLYVGANDGMLHGFNANNGSEVFAFIPAAVYGSTSQPKLAALSASGYSHQLFVDASPRASDAYLSDSWKTILVGATGGGGSSVFAVDVSSPSMFSTAAASKVLWEFSTTSTSADKLGIAMSQPVIARLASGQWVAIFGNGYNSGDNVKLFVVNLADGRLIKAIDTGLSGSNNGLASPVPVDTNGDRITDYVYAGDLLGNLWKFDLSDSNSNQWASAYRQGGAPAPLFAALNANGDPRPITARPVVGRHPNGGLMVYFGTGKYFEVGDNTVGSSPQLQAFYGIRDNGARVTSATSLQQQTITNEGSTAAMGRYRIISNNSVNYVSQNGWYLNLQSPSTNGLGERVVSKAILRFGRIIFTSLIPSQDTCAYGGSSWLMELDAVKGGRLTYSILDTNGDGAIDDNDFVTLPDGTRVPAGGKGYDEIIKTPSIIECGDELECKYTSGSSGTLGVTLEQGSGGKLGRQSWRQLQ